MYSIYTVLNSAYLTFGKVFLNSLYDKLDNSKVKYIFIVDTGLTDEDRLFLSKNDKVKIIDSGVTTNLKGGTEDKEWTQTVVLKTYVLRELLKTYDDLFPIVMIDSDCMFIKDISDLINTDYDLQICHRQNPQTPLLGSYVSFNNKDKCMSFLDKWIDRIPQIETPWKESPALSQIYSENKEKYNIELIPENKVSSYTTDDINHTHIIHFKSMSNNKTVEETIRKRIFDRGFGPYIKENNYLEDEIV